MALAVTWVVGLALMSPLYPYCGVYFAKVNGSVVMTWFFPNQLTQSTYNYFLFAYGLLSSLLQVRLSKNLLKSFLAKKFSKIFWIRNVGQHVIS